MKTLSLLLLLSLSSLAFANDAAIERYINTHIAMMQAQVVQLHDALFLLDNDNMTAQDTFNKIGQPSFKAVDDALKNSGFTHNSFYQFAHKNKTDIDQWLNSHRSTASNVNALQNQRDDLMQDYDQLIKRFATAN
jgi:hypothetical protein